MSATGISTVRCSAMSMTRTRWRVARSSCTVWSSGRNRWAAPVPASTALGRASRNISKPSLDRAPLEPCAQSSGRSIRKISSTPEKSFRRRTNELNLVVLARFPAKLQLPRLELGLEFVTMPLCRNVFAVSILVLAPLAAAAADGARPPGVTLAQNQGAGGLGNAGETADELKP